MPRTKRPAAGRRQTTPARPPAPAFDRWAGPFPGLSAEDSEELALTIRWLKMLHPCEPMSLGFPVGGPVDIHVGRLYFRLDSIIAYPEHAAGRVPKRVPKRTRKPRNAGVSTSPH